MECKNGKQKNYTCINGGASQCRLSYLLLLNISCLEKELNFSVKMDDWIQTIQEFFYREIKPKRQVKFLFSLVSNVYDIEKQMWKSLYTTFEQPFKLIDAH